VRVRGASEEVTKELTMQIGGAPEEIRKGSPTSRGSPRGSRRGFPACAEDAPQKSADRSPSLVGRAPEGPGSRKTREGHNMSKR
jgi:hypothetical protein